MHRPRTGSVPALLAAALLAATALLGLAAPVPAAAAGGGVREVREEREALTADAYWTPARMLAARPAEGTERPGARPAGPVPPSHPFNGLPQVGTFFWTDGHNTGRFCGGTVVRSPHGDLAVSAAHCLRSPDPKKQFSFVPQYHDGLKPHGVFPVRAIHIDQRYYDLGTGKGARWDFAVVRLGPRADGRTVQRAVGAYKLAIRPGYTHDRVRLVGYPGNSDTTYPKPLDCTSSTHRYTSTDPGAPGDFLEIACAGYVGGTSGGPFLVRGPGSSGWSVIGVIGGYHTGGDTPDISYSSYFTDDLLALYRQAVEEGD
ncbi:hypothetical protein GCM10010218_07820 [Streptomyces mashuensis]|uniref:Peptidase S1 domain-containing protein n=1 Tax=Streptomyces mashuensis TaxID=33904 RepID=A0A919AY75_9ACTN|nr:trypsin-like serine protease [Streptomyces mashuensis]GHF29100.1 hypothetical protein GCM10010218_07820 [Streptomyces mashuensis]